MNPKLQSEPDSKSGILNYLFFDLASSQRLPSIFLVVLPHQLALSFSSWLVLFTFAQLVFVSASHILCLSF